MALRNEEKSRTCRSGLLLTDASSACGNEWRIASRSPDWSCRRWVPMSGMIRMSTLSTWAFCPQ
jgi:hypothetical protein